MPDLTPSEATTALVLSVRSMTRRFTPDAFPEPIAAIDIEAELVAVEASLERVCSAGSDSKLVQLREGALARPVDDAALEGLGARVNRAQARIYTAWLVRRGAAKPALNKPKKEDAWVQALALRLVVADLLLGVPDDQVIQANREAYARLGAIDAMSPDAAVARLALESEMAFLGYFMDCTGITERYVARSQRGPLN